MINTEWASRVTIRRERLLTWTASRSAPQAGSTYHPCVGDPGLRSLLLPCTVMESTVGTAGETVLRLSCPAKIEAGQKIITSHGTKHVCVLLPPESS